MTNTREKLSVLLVEDDPLIALDAEDTLTLAGFACLLAYDTDTAMALLKAHDIRAAILDYDLGSETSLSIAEQAYGSHIPFRSPRRFRRPGGRNCRREYAPWFLPACPLP